MGNTKSTWRFTPTLKHGEHMVNMRFTPTLKHGEHMVNMEIHAHPETWGTQNQHGDSVENHQVVNQCKIYQNDPRIE